MLITTGKNPNKKTLSLARKLSEIFPSFFLRRGERNFERIEKWAKKKGKSIVAVTCSGNEVRFLDIHKKKWLGNLKINSIKGTFKGDVPESMEFRGKGKIKRIFDYFPCFDEECATAVLKRNALEIRYGKKIVRIGSEYESCS